MRIDIVPSHFEVGLTPAKLTNLKARYDRYTLKSLKVTFYFPKVEYITYRDDGTLLAPPIRFLHSHVAYDG